ncbi:MAG: hypothetical protein ACK4RN_09000 [Pseudorhodobacter sp.]
MIQELLDNLTSEDASVRAKAGAEAGSFALGLKTLDYQTKSDFERLCRQASSYSDWPESEQFRFRILIRGVRAAAKASGKMIGKDGWPIQ